MPSPRRNRARIRVDGLSELVIAIKNQPDEVKKLLEGIILEATQIIQTEIEARAPRDTGLLAAEGFITKAGYKNKNSVNAVVTISDRKFEYAFYQEFGVASHNQPARPFIRPAFDKKRRAARALVVKKLEEHYGRD